MRLLPSLNTFPIYHLLQNTTPINQILWPQNVWLLRLLPSVNTWPISHLSQNTTPITHLLWPKNHWFLRLLPSLNPFPISHISQNSSPIFHPMWSLNCWLFRLLILTLNNTPFITKYHPNQLSPMITKFMIFENASINLAQYSNYQKFPAQSPISCDHEIADCWDWFLVWEYGMRRIPSLLTDIFLIWYTQIFPGKGLQRKRKMPMDTKWLCNLHQRYFSFARIYISDCCSRLPV